MCAHLLPPVTHQSQSPTWLSRRSKHRVWLKDVQLYVFCQRYRHENMRQNKSGAFEIYFVSEEGTNPLFSLSPSLPSLYVCLCVCVCVCVCVQTT